MKEEPTIGADFSKALSANLIDLVRKGLDDLPSAFEDKDQAYEKALIFSEHMDGISSHIIEAIAGNANMGMVNQTLLNMISKAGKHLIEERSLDRFKALLGVQGRFIVTIGSLVAPQDVHKLNLDFLGLSKALKNWHEALLETNMALCDFCEIGETIVNNIHGGLYGSYGTAGTGENPAIADLNAIREHCESIYGATQKARFYQNIVEEKLNYYRASVTGFQHAVTSTDNIQKTMPAPE